MTGKKQKENHRKLRRHDKNPSRKVRMAIISLVLLLLVGVISIFSIGNWSEGIATTGDKAPRVALETANGQYVIGQAAGRVEVLFFSFPG